jgi:hypothetical protein
MQFPWREYALTAIILSLCIGWAVEHRRLDRYRIAERNAAQWEERARGLGERLAQRIGAPMRVDEFKQIEFKREGSPVAELTVYESVVETRVCQYENSPDGHFLFGRHPEAGNVWLLGGGSGHGFKLAPALGDYAAGILLTDGTPDPLFRLDRPGHAGEEIRTQFDR